MDDVAGMTRRDLLRAGGAGAAGLTVLGAPGCNLSGGQEGGSAPAARDRPNIVLVIIDSLRTDHVGAYGGRRARTPNLDAFARESLLFSRARPESMPTIPARRAIMTGRRSFPFRGWKPEPPLTLEPGWQSIPRHHVTWDTLLRRAGYFTAYCTDNPHILSVRYDRFRRAFDSRPGFRGQLPLRRHPSRKVGDRFLYRYVPPELRDDNAGRLREYLTVNRPGRGEDDYLPARVFRSGIDFLDKANARQPFALVVDCFDPHEPWDPPHRYLRRYADVGRHEPQPIQPFPSPSALTSTLRPSTVGRARALYSGEVDFVDLWFGRLLDKLDSAGLARNTWVVMLSDHGVLLGERGFIGKSHTQLHRELWSIPFMIRHPDGRRAGTRSDYLASTHDVATTLLSIAGVPVPRPMDGVDLSAFFRGHRPRRRTYFTSALKHYVCAADERWLLVCDNQGGDAHLFDRRNDPRELRSVASRHPGQVRRLYRKVVADSGGRRPPVFDLG
jgi:arylsulfatase A-like enzyme